MQDYARKKVLILGEFGSFGAYLARQLVRLPGAEVVLGSPTPGQHEDLARELGVSVVTAEPADEAALQSVIRGSHITINTLGPFRGGEPMVAATCADLGVHYIDPAEAREHVSAIERLARRAERSGACLVAGAGAVPAVSAALAELGIADFERVTELHIFLVPGCEDQRELASAQAILGFLGDPIRVKERGRWREAYGWRAPLKRELPPPLGRRRGYLADLADLDLLPRYYGAPTVTARIGVRSRLFSVGVATAGWLHKRGILRDINGSVRSLLRASRVAGLAAGPGAAVQVEVRGQREGQEMAQTLTLVSRQGGGVISAAPIMALARRWLTHGAAPAGAMPCVGLLDWADLRHEFLEAGADVSLIRTWDESAAG